MTDNITPENRWFGDMMILQVLADSEHVNDQEREVLQRWMAASDRPSQADPVSPQPCLACGEGTWQLRFTGRVWVKTCSHCKGDYGDDEVCKLNLAAQEPASQPSSPSEKLLRRMPSEAMVEAGRAAMSPEKFVSHCRTYMVWQAMWDAAPSPQPGTVCPDGVAPTDGAQA